MGVVHRDVKPANLLLDDGGHLWVTDFGLAKLDTAANLTVSGDLLGTLRYMSPEQALAWHGLVDHRTDVYSLGATLYELLTLRPAVGGADKQETLRQIAFEEPAAPRTLDRAIPAELETVALKCLAKNPNERYATAGELADDLGRWLSHQTIRARRPSLRQRLDKWVRRHSGAVVPAGAVLMLGTAVSAWQAVRATVAERAAVAAAAAAGEARQAEAERAASEQKAKETAQNQLAQIEKAHNILQSILVNPNSNATHQAWKRAFLPLLEEMYKARKDRLGPEHPDTLAIMNSLVMTYFESLDHNAEAVRLAREMLAIQRRRLASNDLRLAQALKQLAWTLIQAGRPAEAEPLVRECLIIYEQRQPNSTSTYYTRGLLGATLRRQGKYGEAEPLLRNALENLMQKNPPGTFRYRLAEGAEEIARLYEETGRPDEARAWRAKVPPDAVEDYARMLESLGQRDEAQAWRAKLPPGLPPRPPAGPRP
jgi:tetratricopeptide (TPR) repeat protein